MKGASRGSTLAITLWSLCLLTIFVLNLGFGARQKIMMTKRLETRDRLRSIAEAGVLRAISELKKRDSNAIFAALYEPWSNNEESFKQIELGQGEFSVSYDCRSGEDDLQQMRYGVMDEERKLNINLAGQKVLERLLQITARLDAIDAQELSASIVDFRDEDSELSIPLGSAEDEYYTHLKNPYEAKDRPFEVPEELFLVKGMSREIFAQIKDYLTVYGAGAVNINTASEEVLLSLGIYASVVDKILSFRYGPDSIEATEDDGVFKAGENIVAKLSQSYSLSAGEAANLSNLSSQGRLITNSSNFMIKSTGRLNNAGASAQLVCVFAYPSYEAGKDGEVRYWREEQN